MTGPVLLIFVAPVRCVIKLFKLFKFSLVESNLFVLFYQIAVTLSLIFTFHSIVANVISSILYKIVYAHVKLIKILEKNLLSPSNKSAVHLIGVYNLLVEGLVFDGADTDKKSLKIMFDDGTIQIKKDLECLSIVGKLVALFSLFVSVISLYFHFHPGSTSDIFPLYVLAVPIIYWIIICSSFFAFKCYIYHFIKEKSLEIKMDANYTIPQDEIIDFSRKIKTFEKILNALALFSKRIKDFMSRHGLQGPTSCKNCVHFK